MSLECKRIEISTRRRLQYDQIIMRDTDISGCFPLGCQEGASCFLNNGLYVLENMVALSDPRKLTEKAPMFYEY